MNAAAFLVPLASLTAVIGPMGVSALDTGFINPAWATDPPEQPDQNREKLHLCTPDETVIFACTADPDGDAGIPAGDATKISVCLGKNRLSYRSSVADRISAGPDSDADWSNIHFGSVIGGSGGHQTHIRFSSQDGEEIIVFEGAPGQYHDASDGKPWAGEYVQAPDGSGHRRSCRAPFIGLMGSMEGDRKIREQTPEKAVRERSVYEVEGGPFDAWW